jgi:hypothetical protein
MERVWRDNQKATTAPQVGDFHPSRTESLENSSLMPIISSITYAGVVDPTKAVTLIATLTMQIKDSG